MSEGIYSHKQHADVYHNTCCTTTKSLQSNGSGLTSSQKLTFHKSSPLGDVVQQLLKDGSDGLFGQHEVLQRGHGGFCHYVTVRKVARSDRNTQRARVSENQRALSTLGN